MIRPSTHRLRYKGFSNKNLHFPFFHKSFLILKKTLLYSAFYVLALALLALPLHAQTTTFNATGGNQTYSITANRTLTITACGGGWGRQSRQQELREGLNKVVFRPGSLPSGVYLIRAIDAAQRQGVVRVSKQ